VSRYRPGDIVARRKGLVMHKGVVMADGRILHNTPFRGEHISDAAEFRAGKRLHVASSADEGRRRNVHTALPDRDRGYNLLTNNCEHTVHRATTGRAHSPQLKSWVAGISLGSVAFALTRHPAAAAAGYALGRSIARRI